METLQNIFQAEIFQRLGWTLLHFIWQAAAIGMVLAIVLKLLRKSTAHSRYLIACMALAAIVVMSAVTIRMVDVSVNRIVPVKQAAIDLSNRAVPTSAVIEIPEIESAPAQVADAPAVPLKDRFIETVERVLPYVVVGWLIGVFGLSLWHLGGWMQLQRLRRQMVKQVSPALQEKCQQFSKSLGIQKTIALVESALVQVPTVLGHLKPIILLPASALTGLNPEQIEAILAHELAHIKRHDYLVNILQTIIEILGFYHPAVWWISHKIRTERENCCDDIAVQLCRDRLGYARALTTMEEIRSHQPTLAIAASGPNLFNRIRRLLGNDSKNESKSSWLPSVLAILLIVALLIPTALALSGGKNDQVDVKDDSVHVYQVNRSVSDFPDNNFSTPESAAAHMNRLLANGETLREISEPSLKKRMRANRPKVKVPEKGAKAWRTAQVEEVRIYKKLYAAVLMRTEKLLGDIIDVRYLKLVDEQWFNMGNDVFGSVEKARKKFKIIYEFREKEQSEIEKIGKHKTEIQSYQVNRKVSDFPDNDFSTPESAYAAINAVSTQGDNQSWAKVSVPRLAKRFKKTKRFYDVSKEWVEVLGNAKILEVFIYAQEKAVVAAELPQASSSKLIRSPIDVRWLEKYEGKWLNTGNDRVNSVAEAKTKFNRVIEKELKPKQENAGPLDDSEELLHLSEELFDKLRKADYEKILSHYDEKTGKWRRDGWKKTGLDYMVHTDWPSFALWVCRTFKDNPIKSVQLGELFISDKEVLENIKAPAVPYKLVLQDGGVLEGDLYFVYWDRTEKWQAAEGIDWHLQDEPIKKLDVQVEEKGGHSARRIDIKPGEFKLQCNPGRCVCSPVVSIKNESNTTIPEFKLRYYRGNVAENLDEAGNAHRSWHIAGPLEPGKQWNERTRDFHLPDGEYEFFVVLDYDNTISETDENNNTASIKVVIKDGQVKDSQSILSAEAKTNSPQILTSGYVLTVPADMPELKNILSGQPVAEPFATEKLEEFLNVARTNPQVRIIATPKILSNNGEAAEIKTEIADDLESVMLNIKNTVQPDGKTIKVRLEFEHRFPDGENKTANAVSSMLFIPDGHAFALAGSEVNNGRMVILLIKPEIQENPSPQTGIVQPENSAERIEKHNLETKSGTLQFEIKVVETAEAIHFSQLRTVMTRSGENGNIIGTHPLYSFHVKGNYEDSVKLEEFLLSHKDASLIDCFQIISRLGEEAALSVRSENRNHEVTVLGKEIIDNALSFHLEYIDTYFYEEYKGDIPTEINEIDSDFTIYFDKPYLCGGQKRDDHFLYIIITVRKMDTPV